MKVETILYTMFLYALEVEDSLGLRILENVFPELRELKPVPGKNNISDPT